MLLPPVMEDAASAGMHVSKRLRTIKLDDQHAPPVGGGGGGGYDLDLDLISQLPDAILGTVVSLLPTKDGARTQAISSRWLPLWRSHMAPLNLVANWQLSNDKSRVAVISKILSDHPGPARRFSLNPVYRGAFLPEADGWFRSVSLSGLQDLQVTNLPIKRYPVPPHALIRFVPTLRVLRLFGCQFPSMVMLPSFPLLEQLIMYDVGISEDSLERMISSSTVLKSVSLHGMGFGRLCISSPTLRSISFYALRSKGSITFQEVVIEDAPCLERLLPILPEEGPATIRVVRAPKLKILGFLSKGISTLHLGKLVFQKMIAVSLTTKIHTVKILALDIGANMDAAVDFLKCFPCLEKLYVILHHGEDMNNVRKYDPLDPIECFQLHLKEVVLKNYDGDKKPCIDFAKFFILNANMLKEMEIGVLNKESDKWMCYLRNKLQVENRASQGAHIELRGNRYAIPINHGCTHDLSLTDPFEKSPTWIQQVLDTQFSNAMPCYPTLEHTRIKEVVPDTKIQTKTCENTRQLLFLSCVIVL